MSAFDEPIPNAAGGPNPSGGGGGGAGGGGLGGGAAAETTPNHSVAVFTVAFKVASLLVYLLGTWFTSNFALIFVLTTILVAADFWFVKNVSGRKLVGLRWWSHVREDGSTNWVFETKPPHKVVNAWESMVFWTSLYATPVVWVVLAIGALAGMGIKWVLVVAVALTLSASNLVGYLKCSKDAKKQIQGWVINQL